MASGRERSSLLLVAALLAVAMLAKGLLTGELMADGAPPRPTTEGPAQVAEWIWSGAVTPTSARVKAKVRPGVGAVRLLVSERADLTGERSFEPVDRARQAGIVTFEPADLEPATKYFFALATGAGIGPLRGSFRTFGSGPFSFTIALSACAKTGSSAPVFDTIREHDPLFFLHLGDFHYENIDKDRPEGYRAAYDRVFASPTQSRLYRSVPTVYIWDDHDFGSNNADRRNPGRRAARHVYQEVVPHYPLVAGEGDVPIYQAFTVGRVRFLVTDSRSEKSPRRMPDNAAKSVLGRRQRKWLEQELLAAHERGELIVWVSTFPWIAPTKPNQDHWGGYSTERQELAGLIHDHGIDSLLMLSGDAHMLAIDDGSNNTYGGGGRGFPVFHAAALDRLGSVKGGPYSHGTFPGRFHFGLMEVLDEGGEITVRWSGRDGEDRELLSHQWTVDPSR